MKISQFAELSGIPRKNLIEYDKKGILKPARQDAENQYRYYSYLQLDTAMIIRMLRELDMPLQEIKEYINHRSPEEFLKLCGEQKKIIKRRIRLLQEMDMVLEARISKTNEGMKVNREEIYQMECEAERIFIGNPLPPFTDSMDSWEYFAEFLKLCREAGIPSGLPYGIMVTQRELCCDREQAIGYFYCRIPKGLDIKGTVIKPAGLYVLGHDFQDHTFSNKYYEKLFAYIENNSLAIAGDGYEFYLFDELSFQKPYKYLVQFAIPVKQEYLC